MTDSVQMELVEIDGLTYLIPGRVCRYIEEMERELEDVKGELIEAWESCQREFED